MANKIEIANHLGLFGWTYSAEYSKPTGDEYKGMLFYKRNGDEIENFYALAWFKGEVHTGIETDLSFERMLARVDIGTAENLSEEASARQEKREEERAYMEKVQASKVQKPEFEYVKNLASKMD